ncbi:4-(cytidine 5'-diphospho)-2-C-methyl-D-erythritol kinase [Candidatus Sumerlaeota bacterium]|nr:4-(cytidine 5'-diphospho)-2-C-methyl-D-erythritol kinase [Candidatus Sumerlaeota bacterium]
MKRIPPRSIRVRAHAKINWSLEVLGKRPDGYHEIDTILQEISLHDVLMAKRIRAARCVIKCDDPAIPTDGRNLIARAWSAMRGAYPDRVGGIAVDLTKRIPSGAGLGGGSSDAAAALRAMNRLFNLRLRKPALASLAAQIGSDVPFFIYGGCARARGRGEIIEPIRSKLPPISLVVVYPGFQSPTAEAYKKLDSPPYHPTRRRRNSATDRIARLIERGEVKKLLRALRNDFDAPLCGSDPRYREVKKRMIAWGLKRPMLSGSGSACFGVRPEIARSEAHES